MRQLGLPKNKEKCVKIVLETGLSYWAEWILDCVQEVGDQELTTMELASPIKSASPLSLFLSPYLE